MFRLTITGDLLRRDSPLKEYMLDVQRSSSFSTQLFRTSLFGLSEYVLQATRNLRNSALNSGKSNKP